MDLRAGMEKMKLGKLRQTTTAVQIRKRREMRITPKQRNSADFDIETTGETRFRRAHSSEWDTRKEDFHTGSSARPSMQTLDKRISTSIDQLDTIRERREAPRFRSNHKFLRETDVNSNDVIFKYKGEQYSKNQYFFGESKHKEQPQEPRKTPFEMFLEDDGPYSRKLFGPVLPKAEEPATPFNRKAFASTTVHTKAEEGAPAYSRKPFCSPPVSGVQLKPEDGPYSRKLFGTSQTPVQSTQSDSRDRCLMKNLVNRSRADMGCGEEDEVEGSETRTREVWSEDYRDVDTKHAVRKGVVWQQRDKLFSRWKERFLVLTRDYLHCFKRGSTRPSEMGEFIFKVKLLQLEGVSLLDKRGYLTVCLCIIREGRIYLRSTQGIREWFQAIQTTMHESRRRRKLWLKENELNSWSQEPRDISREEVWKTTREKNKEDTSQQNNNQIIPKGINRLSLVSDLLMTEAITSLTQRKEVEDSGHDSGQSSMNTAESSSDSEKSGQWATRFKETEAIKKKSGSCHFLDTYTARV